MASLPSLFSSKHNFTILSNLGKPSIVTKPQSLNSSEINLGYFNNRLLISGVNFSIGILSKENSIISSCPSIYAVISAFILSINDDFPFKLFEFYYSLGLF